FSLPMAYGTANRTTSQPSAATGTSPRYQEWWNAPTTPSARPSSASMPYAAPASAPAAGPGGAGVAASPPAATGAVSSVMRPRLADAGEQVGLQEARSAQTALPGGHARHPRARRARLQGEELDAEDLPPDAVGEREPRLVHHDLRG